MTMMNWFFALASIALSAFAQVAMKIGMTQVRGAGVAGAELFRSIALSPFVIGGLSLYGVGAVLWLAVLSKTPLSLAYPLVSLGFVFVAGLSWLMLGEALPLGRVLGIFLILAGVALVGAS